MVVPSPPDLPHRMVPDDLDRLVTQLQHDAHQVIAPRLRDGAIVYGPVGSLDEVATGWRDRLSPGHYRLQADPDGALFGHHSGPNAWKEFLHSPEQTLLCAERQPGGRFKRTDHADEPPRFAFLGVRPCELAAIQRLDAVLLNGACVDPGYAARRQRAFLIAVECSAPGDLCFCTSLGTGPAVQSGFDLALTEVPPDLGGGFVARTGSASGDRMIDRLALPLASPDQAAAARALVAQAAESMPRSIQIDGLRELLYRHYEHPYWTELGNRCLTCANCTMVCPTCFCTTVEDSTDLAGRRATRIRRWDSCHTLDYSYIHGGSVRTSPAARYRHWMMHKLVTWQDQFGTPGCVGCGRCIAWCPVGIDLTAEAAAFRRLAHSDSPAPPPLNRPTVAAEAAPS